MAKSSPQSDKNKLYFSNKLNELLNLNNKKQIDLHRDLNIPKSTITGYVKGTSLPTMGNLQKIADYFNVLKSDIDLRFKIANDNNEDGLKLSLLSKYEKLNTDNKKKVVEYADNRLKNQMRQENKIHPISELDNTYYVDVLGSVSAGTGEWLDDEQHEEITVNNEPPVHDFALRVNGDSMIPLFSDGQIIYVNKIDDLDMVRNEQIVIAELNGDAYVKKIVFDNNRQSCQLISLNKDYQPINITENDEFKVVGLVVL